MTFDDVNPETFNLLVMWLYSGTIKANNKSGRMSLEVLGNLWSLADRFVIKELQETVVDLAIAQFKETHYEGFAQLLGKAYEVKDGDHSLGRAAIYAAASMASYAFTAMSKALTSTNPKLGLDIARAMKWQMERTANKYRGGNYNTQPWSKIEATWEDFDRFERDLNAA